MPANRAARATAPPLTSTRSCASCPVRLRSTMVDKPAMYSSYTHLFAELKAGQVHPKAATSNSFYQVKHGRYRASFFPNPGVSRALDPVLRTLSQVSCWNGERSVLNFRRWALGDDSYGTDVARYRIYQVNHEVGHGLGHQHRMCPGKGKRAPVMVQQTLDLGGCKPWPYPSGA